MSCPHGSTRTNFLSKADPRCGAFLAHGAAYVLQPLWRTDDRDTTRTSGSRPLCDRPRHGGKRSCCLRRGAQESHCPSQQEDSGHLFCSEGALCPLSALHLGNEIDRWPFFRALGKPLSLPGRGESLHAVYLSVGISFCGFSSSSFMKGRLMVSPVMSESRAMVSL